MKERQCKIEVVFREMRSTGIYGIFAKNIGILVLRFVKFTQETVGGLKVY